MHTKLSRVVIALAVVIALVGAIGVVNAEVNTNPPDAASHSGGDHVGHMIDSLAGMGEMAHVSEHTNGSMMEQMDHHESGDRHHGNHHESGDSHHERGHGRC